jgi:hypothetical protein
VPIPHVFHRIWIGAAMPPEFEAFGPQWANLNPGWEVRTWGEADIDALGMVNRDLYDRAPELCPERFIPRFRANLARYEILHRHGGVYVDTDLRPLAPMPDLDGIGAFAGWEREPEWIGNSVLGCAPGHEFFARLIDGAAASVAAHPGARSPVTTGPQYLTRTWRADPGDLHLFAEPVFYPQHWRDITDDLVPHPDTVAHHLWAALRGQVSVVIPFRPDGAERDRNLAWVLDRLRTEHPDWQVHIEVDETDQPFNRAALLRSGVAKCMGDIIVAHDGDVWCPDLPQAVQQVRNGSPWAIPHTNVHRLTPDATTGFLAGGGPSDDLDEPAYVGTASGGAAVITREAFHQVPPDDRFAGWGGEDQAWGRALWTLIGAPWRSEEPLWHLWHPPQQRKTRDYGNEANLALERRYRAANGNPLAMRALIERRDPEDMDIAPSGIWRDIRTGRLTDVQPEEAVQVVAPGLPVPQSVREAIAAQASTVQAVEEAVLPPVETATVPQPVKVDVTVQGNAKKAPAKKAAARKKAARRRG